MLEAIATRKPYLSMLVLGFKLVAGAIASNAFTGVAIGVGFIFASLVYSISRNPSQRDELLLANACLHTYQTTTPLTITKIEFTSSQSCDG